MMQTMLFLGETFKLNKRAFDIDISKESVANEKDDPFDNPTYIDSVKNSGNVQNAPPRITIKVPLSAKIARELYSICLFQS